MRQDIDDQMLAEKMAATLMALRGSPGVMDRYFAVRIACPRECWRKVISILAQAENKPPALQQPRQSP